MDAQKRILDANDRNRALATMAATGMDMLNQEEDAGNDVHEEREELEAI